MSETTNQDQLDNQVFDVVIVGGGHNGLTAAAYLARKGLSVKVLERLDHFGGAAVSEQTFSGISAKLSRYSYLVSLLPQSIIDDLELDIKLAPRRYSSYTPRPKSDRGLLIDNQDHVRTFESFESVGAASDFETWGLFYEQTRELAKALFPTVTEPLRTREQAKELLRNRTGSDDIWNRFIEEPVGEAIFNDFESDLVRGVVLTDGLIGTFGANGDRNLDVNKCFLYHVIGNETGEWNVPIGGMGTVSEELKKAALKHGAILVNNAEVLSIKQEELEAPLQIKANIENKEVNLKARYLLANVSPTELDRLLGKKETPMFPIEGSQVKVNMLLTRLPKLRDQSVTPEIAFSGTFHANEGWNQLHNAHLDAERGEFPSVLPCEIYCHTLTDPSILSEELQAQGAHTLTVFALHTPHRLLSGKEHDQMRHKLQNLVLDSINSLLAEPIQPLLMLDDNEVHCIETKTTQDLEDELRLPGGNIFHSPLQWPFLEEHEETNTPAKRWGVATENPNILVCGSGAKRGGAVSALGGHNAAMAIIETLGLRWPS